MCTAYGDAVGLDGDQRQLLLLLLLSVYAVELNDRMDRTLPKSDARLNNENNVRICIQPIIIIFVGRL